MVTRNRVAVALVILASLLAFVALPALWVNRQVLNTDNWTKTSSELLADPVIRDQVAVFLVDQLYANVDVTTEIRDALPDRFKPLAGPAAGGLRNLAERAANDILARPRAQQAWEAANRAAQRQLLTMLDGGNATLSTENGVVVLNLKSLLEQLADRVGIGGRLAGALPPGAAELTILRSNQLKAAQTGSKAVRALPIVLVGLSLVLFGIALLIAPDRRRKTVRGYGAGLIAAGSAALVAASVGGTQLVHSLAGTAAAEPVVRHTWTIATPLLHQASVAAIGYGVVMVLGAWLAGPTRPATAVRHALAPYLREPLIAYAGLAVVLAVVLFWWAPTPATRNPATAVLLVALVALGFEGLRRKAARERPDADREAALRAHGERLRRFGRQGAAMFARGDSEPTVVEAGQPARLADLERLAHLRETGVLDDAEFRAEKARVLGEPEPANGAPAPEAGQATGSVST